MAVGAYYFLADPTTLIYDPCIFEKNSGDVNRPYYPFALIFIGRFMFMFKGILLLSTESLNENKELD